MMSVCNLANKLSSRPTPDDISSYFLKGSGYFASRGKIAPCNFAIWRQNSPSDYFAASAKIALSLILTQTLTQTLTLILTLIQTLTLTLTQTLTQTEEKHYFASRGKIATSFLKQVAPAILDFLTYECNVSLTMVIVPNVWKLAITNFFSKKVPVVYLQIIDRFL